MATRRNFRRAGSWAWRNRRTISRAAYTFLALKPIINEPVNPNARYNIVDLTESYFDSTTGSGPMESPTITRVRGVLVVRRIQTSKYNTTPFGYGLFVGPRGLDADDIPFFFSEPDRFMGYATHTAAFAPLSPTDQTYAEGSDGLARPWSMSTFGVRARIQRRLRLGDRLFLVTRVAPSMTDLETETQAPDFTIQGEISVVLKAR